MAKLWTPLYPPAECPDCNGERYWDRHPDGSVDAVCSRCGRRGSHDDLACVKKGENELEQRD